MKKKHEVSAPLDSPRSEVRAALRPMLVVQWFNEASKVCPRQRLRRMRSSVRWDARLRLAQCPCLLLVVSASRPLVSCVCVSV